MSSNESRGHAIVVGGSIAGLLAARVLSDHFDKVTILDRDTLPEDSRQRRGVPQGHHTHGLLASGRNMIEKYFPGISKSLVDTGAITGDIVRDSRWFFEGACLCRFESGLNGLLMTRPLLEAAVRERVLKIPNVTLRDSVLVEGLLTDQGTGRVTGVRAGGEALPADLTVDASGRASHSPQWLESIGFARPREETVHIALGYTTRLFRRRKTDLEGDTAAIIPPTPEGKRGGVMLAQEGERWTVTLVSHFGKSAPEDLAGFIEYSRTLPAPFIYDVIRHAEPLGDAAVAKFPASARRRYEAMKRFPEGYLVFGDAICSFNPVYGQGMSVAALESVQLDASLKANNRDLANHFFRGASKIIDIPWTIAVGNDLRMPEVAGPRTAAVKLINWYMSKLHRAGHFDPVPALAFHTVGNLLAPPPSIMRPRVAVRVLWQNIKPRRKSAAPEDTRTKAAAAS